MLEIFHAVFQDASKRAFASDMDSQAIIHQAVNTKEVGKMVLGLAKTLQRS
jgi:hypothetical protein